MASAPFLLHLWCNVREVVWGFRDACLLLNLPELGPLSLTGAERQGTPLSAFLSWRGFAPCVCAVWWEPAPEAWVQW